MPKINTKYVESEAEHSGDETGASDMDDGMSNDSYEKGSFVVSDDENDSGDEESADKFRAKQRKKEGDKEQEEILAAVKQLKQQSSSGKKRTSSLLDAASTDSHSAVGAQGIKKNKSNESDSSAPMKPMKGKEGKEQKEQKEVYKPQGNKSLDLKHVPPEPVKKAATTAKNAGSTKNKKQNDFLYSIRFTNARHAQSFWEVASKALPYLFFHIEVTEEYSGLRLEAHDTPPTMAIKSRMECIIEEGVDEHGNPIDRLSLNGQNFCVNSKNLLKCFKCGQVKDTPLNLIKYHNKDGMVFEALTNEEDVQTRYILPFYFKTPSTIVQRLPTKSDMQVKMATHVLQKLANIAATLNASVLRFDLFEADTSRGGPSTAGEDVSRFKLTVYFSGSEIQGGHTFFLGAKRNNVQGIDEFEPVVTTASEQESIDWKIISSNSYTSNKFKIFVTNLNNEWCFVGISTDERAKPLIIVADSTETGNTSHTIIISPQQPEDDNME
jgi:hypothetical protein